MDGLDDSSSHTLAFADDMPVLALKALEPVAAVGMDADGAAVLRRSPASVGKFAPDGFGGALMRGYNFSIENFFACLKAGRSLKTAAGR